MRSFLTVSQRIEVIGRMIVPYGFMALLFLFNVMAVPYPLSLVLGAPFVLMVVYYWTITRPTLIPLWLVFTAGLCIDLLGGLPLGLNALTLVLVRLLIFHQRRFLTGQGFMVMWLGFVMLNFAVHLAQWGIVSLLNFQLLPLQSVWMLILLGTIFFPFTFVFLHLTHKMLPAALLDNSFGSQTRTPAL